MKILGSFEFEIDRNKKWNVILEDIIVAILCHLVWYAPTLVIAGYIVVTAPDAGFRAIGFMCALVIYPINRAILNILYQDKWYD